MRDIKIKKIGEKPKRKDLLKELMRNKFILAALAVLVVGVAMFAYAHNIRYISYNEVNQYNAGTVSNHGIANLTQISSISGHQTNISVKLNGTSEMPYKLYSISVYTNKDRITVTETQLVLQGNVTPNGSIVLPAKSYSQNYYMLLGPGNLSSTSYSVTVTTTIPQVHYGYPAIGIPSLAIIAFGATFLAVSLTVGIRNS